MALLSKFIPAGCVLALWSAGLLGAAEADNGEARLRETLRGTMLQLRTAQNDLANLQAAQAAEADEKKALNDQIALLKKHSAEDRVAGEKTAEGLKAKLAEQTGELARLKEAVVQWKAEYEKLAGAARSAEAERARLAVDRGVLDRRVAELKLKNAALFRLGNEILTRYEKLGLGEQFLAREPFIGRTRVALENLVQDYSDKLADQKAKP